MASGARQEVKRTHLRQPAYRSRLDQRLPHPPRDRKLLLAPRLRVRRPEPVLQRVGVHFGYLIGPVERRECGGGDEGPGVAREVRVPPEGGE